MCDDVTEAENLRWFTGRPMRRRDLGPIGAGAVAAMLPGCASGAGPEKADTREIASRTVEITTADGKADAWFVHPAGARHPAVIMWPDIAGLREAYQVMGSRLARSGYAVLVVNQYYRSAPAPVLSTLAEWMTDAGKEKLKPMIAAITPDGTARDAAAFVDWLDRQPEVDATSKVGTCGYCMGGAFTFRTAAERPKRVGALASFHGGGLATDAADSPHLLIPKMQGALLVAIAQNDDARDPKVKEILRSAADTAGRPAEIEVYPAQHGWCTIDAPVHDGEQAEKAWNRMLATFEKYL